MSPYSIFNNLDSPSFSKCFNTNSSSEIREFVQEGRIITYLDRNHTRSGVGWDYWALTMGATWTTLAFDFPTFVRKILLAAGGDAAGSSVYSRPKGGSGLGYFVFDGNSFAVLPTTVHLNASQECEVVGTATANFYGVADSFYLGDGM